jgi:putative hydrolase of the HAD superfamily
MPVFNKNSFVVFDLDDTLYNEIDYLKSAYRHIANTINPAIENNIYSDLLNWYNQGLNPFSHLIEKYPTTLSLNQLLDLYRFHKPQIQIHKEASIFMQWLIKQEIPLGLITDGRSITQRNKLKSLQIIELFTDIIISEEFGSEKPNKNNYLYFNKKYPHRNFTYLADNTKKDFIAPNELNWQMICLHDNGNNIHKQELKLLPNKVIQISGFSDLIELARVL